jgi:hypothetical protein
MEFDIDDWKAISKRCGLRAYFKSYKSGKKKTPGVWPIGESEREWDIAGADFQSWKPARAQAKTAGNPRTKNIPALPFPFTERQLAAFMLYGMGAMVADYYGEWESGPNQERLELLSGDDDGPQAAILGAYAAYKAAAEKVGSRHLELNAKSDSARIMYNEAMSAALEREQVSDAPDVSNGVNLEYQRRLARAKDSVKELDDERERTWSEWDTANQNWLNAMVRELLGAGVEIESPAPATGTQPQAAPEKTPVAEAPEWKARAAKRAAEIIASDKKKDLYPSQENIADTIANEFRAAGVVGAGGKPMTGAYIKRHALKGISSEQGRQLSTATRRGK